MYRDASKTLSRLLHPKFHFLTPSRTYTTLKAPYSSSPFLKQLTIIGAYSHASSSSFLHLPSPPIYYLTKKTLASTPGGKPGPQGEGFTAQVYAAIPSDCCNPIQNSIGISVPLSMLFSCPPCAFPPYSISRLLLSSSVPLHHPPFTSFPPSHFFIFILFFAAKQREEYRCAIEGCVRTSTSFKRLTK